MEDFYRPTAPKRSPVVESYIDAIKKDGYVIIPDVFNFSEVQQFKDALSPYLMGQKGRNNFEGYETERVYALLAKHTIFSKLVEHPLIISIVDQFLLPSYLLWGFLAINIHPGETPQRFHTDDEGAAAPRPRAPAGISLMWALNDFTEDNGATEFIPYSHEWPDGWKVEENDSRVKKAIMKAGSVMIWSGMLVHRGGANTSNGCRLSVTTQYCQPWLRTVENMSLAVPAHKAAQYSERIRGMLGYSVLEGSFMGYVNGLSPMRLVEEAAEKYGIQQVSYFD